MKKLLLIPTVVLTLTVAHSQTNVSGGIFSNTTWTIANSPYIVTDTVVVFPGVTLTIQPGVAVKFANNKRLEVRQAQLIAIGTSTDSITFTSNSSMPSLGIWSGIFINPNTPSKSHKFSFCNFLYADNAITKEWGDSLIIKNSTFKYNNSGIGNKTFSGIGNLIIDSSKFNNNLCGVGSFYNNPNGTRAFGNFSNSNFSKNQQAGIIIGYSNVSNCILNSNQTGIWLQQGINIIKNCTIDSNSVQGIYCLQDYNDTIINCNIKNNVIGIFDDRTSGYPPNYITQNIIEYNSIGIKSKHSDDSIYCNKICNNATYAFQYIGTNNTSSVAHNYWCTPDSASTQAVIYDAYDNVNVGLVYYMPLDTSCSPSIPTSINESIQISSFRIFPNPFCTQTVLQTDNLLHNATLTVDNCFGQTVAQIKNISGQTITFNRGNLASGLYFVRLTTPSPKGEGWGEVYTGKLIITD